jgi:3-dehydroquinate dehydratase-1
MLCVSIAENDVNKIISEIETRELAEIRLDAGDFTEEDVRKIFGSTNTNLIATHRTGRVSDDTRILLLSAAIESGASYIDIDVENSDIFKNSLIKKAKEKGTTIIVSYHNFESTPQIGELKEVMRWCKESGADIIKIASAVSTPQEAARILALYQYDSPIVALGMGDYGKITRVASVMLGAPFTYVSPVDGKKTAPGQIDLGRMQEILNLINQE